MEWICVNPSITVTESQYDSKYCETLSMNVHTNGSYALHVMVPSIAQCSGGGQQIQSS